jgi:hypothetical protein
MSLGDLHGARFIPGLHENRVFHQGNIDIFLQQVLVLGDQLRGNVQDGNQNIIVTCGQVANQISEESLWILTGIAVPDAAVRISRKKTHTQGIGFGYGHLVSGQVQGFDYRKAGLDSAIHDQDSNP